MTRARPEPSVDGKGRRPTARHLVALVVAMLAGPALAQSVPGLPADQAAIVEAVRLAALRAVNFAQGDLASLTRAQSDFTPEGWRAFMKRLDGFLDARGAPQFSSEFVPSGPPAILGRGTGTLHLSPGTLTQRRNGSSTTYRSAALDVEARGTPAKIDRLEQVTCVGLPSGAVCR